MATVSIVMPLYNVESWVEESLTTAVTQTVASHELEIVVVNDGSTDRSAEVADSVLKRHTVPYRIFTISNGGPSRARNTGWQKATGEWIQFLDGDDLLHPRKIEVQLAAGRCQGPETAVAYSEWQRLNWQASGFLADSYIASPRIGTDALADLLRPDNFISTGSQLFRRSWLERVHGFDERHRLIEDVDLLMRVAMCGGGFHRVSSAEPLFFYRQREGSLSSSAGPEFWEGCIRNAQMAETYWREKNALNTDRAELVASIYFLAARYFASRDKDRFDAIVDRIEMLSPRMIPQGPRHLKYASRIVGYRQAERLAVLYRRIKALAAV